MTSGLIYAAIAIMWAAVLIPMWLRGDDSTVENKSAERFGQAMRVLSRRDSEDDDAEPPQPEPVAVADQPEAASRSVSSPPRQAVRSPRASLAHRRARTLAVLAGLTVLLSLVAAAGPLPFWAPLPVLALLVVFVVHLRNQAKRSEAQRARRSRTAVEPAQESVAHGAPAPAAEAVTAAVAAPRRSAMARFVPGPSRAMVVETKGVGSVTPSVDAADLTNDALTSDDLRGDDLRGDDLRGHDLSGHDLSGHDLSGHALNDNESWRPNPLPVPTYVTAPKAIRPIKVIDLTTPGSWSSGRLLDDEGLPDEDLLAADVEADELDGLLEHEAKGANERDRGRRAVGD